MTHLVLGRVRALARLSAVASLLLFATHALAQNVVIFDGFGDADRDNNGIIDEQDVDVAGAGTMTTMGPANTYVPARLDSLFDGGDATLINPELDPATVASDPNFDGSDTGIRWYGIRGFTGGIPGDGSQSPTVRIVDDSQGSMQETMTTGAGALSIPAIDDGFALAVESRGGGLTSAGFFDDTIELGPNVGDEVKVSFDFRFWRDAGNGNSPANNEPVAGELRFGLFQDTDNQLGQVNPFAGQQVDLDDPPDGFLDFTPATWGQEHGEFSGQLITDLFGGINNTPPGGEIGSFGDNGWTASAFFGNSFIPNGGATRIREELQADEILQGSDVHTIAQPEDIDPDPFNEVFDFVTLDNDAVYTFSLSLVRDTTDPEGAATPDTITATLTFVDKATGTVLGTLSGTEMLEDSTSGGVPIPGTGGIQSDSWDYFAIRNASNGSNEFDFLLDNFTVEVNGGSAPLLGDADGDGDVDGDDLIAVQTEFGATGPTPLLGDADNDGDVDGDDLIAVQTEFGNVASTAVPEPGAATLAVLSFGCLLARAVRFRL